MSEIDELTKRVEVLEKGLADMSKLECEIASGGEVLMQQLRALRSDIFKLLISKGGNS